MWKRVLTSGPCVAGLLIAFMSAGVGGGGWGCASTSSSSVELAPASPAESTPSPLHIEVLGFSGCPNIADTRANVASAVTSLALAATIEQIDQERLASGDPRRDWPSPTVLVNGRDLFGLPAPRGAAMDCRLYAHGAPTQNEIIIALQSMVRR